MLVLRRLFALALVSVACAARLDARQATNTNAAINKIIDQVDITMHQAGPAILMLEADHKLSTSTLATQMTSIDNAFTRMRTGLAATPVSSGSNTTSPTNDEISITLSDAMQLVATSLSGIMSTGAVPGFPTMVATLDPILSGALAQYNTTLPGGLALVHIMMLDASQFLRAEGFTKTLTTLGF
ncbi:Poxa3b laccase small subunit [Mycena venus]|uniref:Poxa3b laccase small subunit n=1 Tax=Mycena venus TaxID=2733690 RepID=A0A8H6X542_9AGAR|nr:Poxa3b laccase small subunit [Mycena venus]